MAHKLKKITSYSVIPNNWMSDARLNLKTRGLLCTLQSLPNNWEFTIKGLAKILEGESEYSINKCIKEAVKLGYLKWNQARDNEGNFSGNEVELYDKSTDMRNSQDGQIYTNIINNNNKVNTKINNDGLSDLDDFIIDVLTTAGYSCCKTNVVDARPSARDALKAGKPKEDILKAAKNIKNYTGDIRHSIRSPFQSTAFWMNQGQVKKGTIIT